MTASTAASTASSRPCSSTEPSRWHGSAERAVASLCHRDTLIGVVRAWTLARHQHLSADVATPLAALGGLLLWLLRLALAPASTLAGFGAWVLAECPSPPAAGRAASEEGDQDGPVPGSSYRTARVSRLHPAHPRRLDQRRPGPPARPEHRSRPDRPAQSRRFLWAWRAVTARLGSSSERLDLGVLTSPVRLAEPQTWLTALSRPVSSPRRPRSDGRRHRRTRRARGFAVARRSRPARRSGRGRAGRVPGA
jgi:hypothetical protein